METVETLKAKMEGLVKNLLPQMKNEFEALQKTMTEQRKPIEEKNVNIDGVNCVAQLYIDGVKIITTDNKKYYDSLTIKKKKRWLIF